MKTSLFTSLLSRILIFGIAAAAGPLVNAGNSSSTTGSQLDRMTPPRQCVEVKVGAFLIDITKIDGVEQLFHADVIVRISWQDPRLVNKEGITQTKSIDEIWNPRMAVANMRDVKLLQPKVVEISSEGEVVYQQRMLGDFTGRLDLKEFPYDRQSLGVHVIAKGYSPEQINFVIDRQFTGRAEELTISDWAIGEVDVKALPYIVPRLGEVSGVRLQFPAKRHLSYYVATIFVSAAIIVCMAWMVFWMPPEAINPRISISVTSMLTLIAHRFVVGGDLPRLSYLTQMDYFLLGSTFMVLLGLVGVVTVARVSSRGRPEMGIKLNSLFRWLYPTVFCAMLLWLTYLG